MFGSIANIFIVYNKIKNSRNKTPEGMSSEKLKMRTQNILHFLLVLTIY